MFGGRRVVLRKLPSFERIEDDWTECGPAGERRLTVAERVCSNRDVGKIAAASCRTATAWRAHDELLWISAPEHARKSPSRNRTAGPFLPAIMAPFFAATVKGTKRPIVRCGGSHLSG